jgi:ribosomal protein L37AE/L43A
MHIETQTVEEEPCESCGSPGRYRNEMGVVACGICYDQAVNAFLAVFE